MNEPNSNSLQFFSKHESGLSEGELSGLLEALDHSFLDRIRDRPYFTSYKALSEKFLDKGRIYYCRDGDLLVGAAVYYADADQFEYAFESYIGVLATHQSAGIGGKLMVLELAECRDLGMKGLITNSHNSNHRKRNLNQKLGFREISDPEERSALENSNAKWEGKAFYKIDFNDTAL